MWVDRMVLVLACEVDVCVFYLIFRLHFMYHVMTVIDSPEMMCSTLSTYWFPVAFAMFSIQRLVSFMSLLLVPDRINYAHLLVDGFYSGQNLFLILAISNTHLVI